MKKLIITTFAIILSLSLYAQGKPFITKWDLSKRQNTTQINFYPNTVGNTTYSWEEIGGTGAVGSGSFNNNSGTITTISSLPANAIIRLKIDTTNFRRIGITGGLSIDSSLIDVEQWGDVNWLDMVYTFKNCIGLDISATDIPNLSNVKFLNSMFNGCSKLTGPTNINSWDVSNVTVMNAMFWGTLMFNQPLNNWNVSNVKNLSNMFTGSNFNQPINNWNVSSVTNMSQMFYNAKKFNQPLNSWNVSSVTDMNAMFLDAYDFNQPLDNWNVSKVTDMNNMFYSCTNFNQPLNNWDVSKVNNMYRMFTGAINFNQPLNNWNVSNVWYMNYMFFNTPSFNQPLNNWNVSNVGDMSYMFYKSGFNQPLNNWNVSNVGDMSYMFGKSNFNQPLNNWNVSNVSDMSKMFYRSNFNQNIGMWILNDSIYLFNMFDSSQMSCINYDSTLIGWSSNINSPINRTLGAQDVFYSTNGSAARTLLVNTKNWTITGDTFVASCVLPLNLLSFTTQLQQNKVALDWRTNNQYNVSHFNIQRSLNGKDFETVAKTKSQNCNECNYQFLDDITKIAITQKTIYYRLQIVDNDGSTKYSSIQKINLAELINSFSIYPNPTHSSININCDLLTGLGNITITDLLGKQLRHLSLRLGINSIDVNNLTKGIYFVTIEANNQTKVQKLLIE